MTDKLKQAAETAIWNLEAIATSDWRRWEDSATPERFEAWVKHKADYAAEALRQALKQPDELLEIAKEIVLDAEDYDYDEWFCMIDMSTYMRLVDFVKSQDSHTDVVEPDTGTDRGAWSDVPNVTKWVDELRGDEPQRDWVGLTDEDMAELRRNGAHSVSDADFRAIEAKLKQLNT